MNFEIAFCLTFIALMYTSFVAMWNENFYHTWTPTAENINKLPEKVRVYIHDLETRSDPAGDLQQLFEAKAQIEGLAAKYNELLMKYVEVREKGIQ